MHQSAPNNLLRMTCVDPHRCIYSGQAKQGTYYCWIIDEQEDEKSFVAELLFIYLPTWAAIVYIFLQNFYIISYLRRNYVLTQQEIDIYRRILLYPLILVVCTLFSTVKLTLEIAYREVPFLILVLSQVFAWSQGLLDALVYGLTPVVKIKLKELFSRKQPEPPQQVELQPQPENDYYYFYRKSFSNSFL